MSLLKALGLPASPPAAAAAAAGEPKKGEPKKASPTPPLEFSFPVTLPELPLSYVTAKAKLVYVFTINPSDEESAVDVKFNNLSPELKVQYQQKVKSELAEKYGKEVKISDGLNVTKEGGTLGFDVDLEDVAVKGRKLTVGFHIFETDKKEHTIEWASLEVAGTYPVGGRQWEIAGMRIGYSGRVEVKIAFQPNWKKIGAYLLQKLGITIAEDAGAGVAAGGMGTAGSVAIAAAGSPAIVVTGGIAGGLALTAGAMAMIDALERQGKDAPLVCSACAKQLWDYAESYGSTMRGKPGKSAEGNKDAEAALQKIMASAKGTTHEQAVDAAIKSGQNFYELAYQALLPKMRAAAKDAYDKLHPYTGDTTFNDVLNQMLAPGSHYGSAPPVPRSAAAQKKIEEDAEQSGPRFQKAKGIETDIAAAQKKGMRLGKVLEKLVETAPKQAAGSKGFDEAAAVYDGANTLVAKVQSCIYDRPENRSIPLDQRVAAMLDKGAHALDEYNKAIRLFERCIAQYPKEQVKAAIGAT